MDQKNITSVQILPEWSLQLGFEVEPAIAEPFETLGSHCYTSGPYRLEICLGGTAERRIIDFCLSRTDGKAFTTHRYVVTCMLPAVDLYNVSPMFVGYNHTHHSNPDSFLITCPSKDSPYVMYGSRNGENRFTIGLENQYIESVVSRIPQGVYPYCTVNKISFERPIDGVCLNGHEVRDAIFLSTERDNWFNVTRAYWDFIDNRRNYIPKPTPISAYGPLWCSWLYVTDIDEDKIWRNALKAKELGIKTLMIDAGWFCADTDIPFFASPLTSDTFGFGRIDSDGSKFPDMKGLVERLHELGLYVWAWCTPRWAFNAVEEGETAVDRRLLDCRIQDRDGKRHPLLCARYPDTREHAARFTAHLLEKYGFDGLKFDCWELDADIDMCFADHHHDCDTMGEGILKWGEAIYNGMTAVKSDAVVWLSNTAMKPYSNYSCSPNEVYCQPDEQWRMGVLLKTFTNGIVSQLSEGSWHMDEPNKNVARFLSILMMGHVPEVQVDLTCLKPDHERILKHYLAFYHAHRDNLLFGKYTPFGFEHTLGGPLSTTPPHVKIEAEDEAFAWIGPVVCDALKLNDARRLYIFNLKSMDGLRVRVDGLKKGDVTITEHDCFMNPVRSYVLKNDNVLDIDSALEYGCMLSIDVSLNNNNQ